MCYFIHSSGQPYEVDSSINHCAAQEKTKTLCAVTALASKAHDPSGLRLANNEHIHNRFALVRSYCKCKTSLSFYSVINSVCRYVFVFLSTDLSSCHSHPPGLTADSRSTYYVYGGKKTFSLASRNTGYEIITNSNTAHSLGDCVLALCSLPLCSLFSPSHFRLSVPVEERF